jgi:hypothetical protein
MSKNEENGQALLVIAAYMPSMILRIFASYVRMKRHARKAGRDFYDTLVENGVPPSQARSLADEYVSVISLRSIIQQLDRPQKKVDSRRSKKHAPGP